MLRLSCALLPALLFLSVASCKSARQPAAARNPGPAHIAPFRAAPGSGVSRPARPTGPRIAAAPRTSPAPAKPSSVSPAAVSAAKANANRKAAVPPALPDEPAPERNEPAFTPTPPPPPPSIASAESPVVSAAPERSAAPPAEPRRAGDTAPSAATPRPAGFEFNTDAPWFGVP